MVYILEILVSCQTYANFMTSTYRIRKMAKLFDYLRVMGGCRLIRDLQIENISGTDKTVRMFGCSHDCCGMRLSLNTYRRILA